MNKLLSILAVMALLSGNAFAALHTDVSEENVRPVTVELDGEEVAGFEFENAEGEVQVAVCIVICFDRPGLGLDIPGVVNGTISIEGDDLVGTAKVFGTGASAGIDANEGPFVNGTIVGQGIILKPGTHPITSRGPSDWHEADEGDDSN